MYATHDKWKGCSKSRLLRYVTYARPQECQFVNMYEFLYGFLKYFMVFLQEFTGTHG